jgi:protein-L-isoaspartate(D-aspartate) O-methyltransferase
MTTSPDDWRPAAARLADQLTEQRIITDPTWRKVVAAVPRHLLVPEFYSKDDEPQLITADDPRWSELVYSDNTLVTQQKEDPDHPGFAWATSSSTRPSLMLRMLHLLDLRDGLTVLEIGTGTGYNAALLSERLGADAVTTIDIDPELTDAARVRLADAGYHPTVVAADGPGGYLANAPYDRIIATVANERVPYPWVAQTRPGGMILADVRPRGMTWAGALAQLTAADDGTATGPLISCTWGFMSTRPDVERPGAPNTVPWDARTVYTRTSDVTADAIQTPGLSLLIWRYLPGINAFPGSDAISITTPDGSWATVTTTTPAKIEHGGPSDIWQQVEDAHAWWIRHDRPDVNAFGLTINGPHDQRLWYQTPDAPILAAPGVHRSEEPHT